MLPDNMRKRKGPFDARRLPIGSRHPKYHNIVIDSNFNANINTSLTLSSSPTNAPPTGIASLPDELWVRILSNVGEDFFSRDVSRLRVCKRWHRIAQEFLFGHYVQRPLEFTPKRAAKFLSVKDRHIVPKKHVRLIGDTVKAVSFYIMDTKDLIPKTITSEGPKLLPYKPLYDFVDRAARDQGSTSSIVVRADGLCQKLLAKCKNVTHLSISLAHPSFLIEAPPPVNLSSEWNRCPRLVANYGPIASLLQGAGRMDSLTSIHLDTAYFDLKCAVLCHFVSKLLPRLKHCWLRLGTVCPLLLGSLLDSVTKSTDARLVLEELVIHFKLITPDWVKYCCQKQKPGAQLLTTAQSKSKLRNNLRRLVNLTRPSDSTGRSRIAHHNLKILRLILALSPLSPLPGSMKHMFVGWDALLDRHIYFQAGQELTRDASKLFPTANPEDGRSPLASPPRVAAAVLSQFEKSDSFFGIDQRLLKGQYETRYAIEKKKQMIQASKEEHERMEKERQERTAKENQESVAR